MSVNLQKGQKVDLRKSDGGTLKKVIVGLGWDEVQKSAGGFFNRLFKSKEEIDCDASAMICINGRLMDASDIVFFNNLVHKSGAIRHMGDNRTGQGEGDDEQIMVNLSSLPATYDKIIIVVNIYQARERKQHFGLIQNAFIRICDAENGHELCKYNLSENYDNMTAMIFGELYLHNGNWKFNAIGQATQDNTLGELAQRFI